MIIIISSSSFSSSSNVVIMIIYGKSLKLKYNWIVIFFPFFALS